jgi:hypothetical protein
MRVLAVLLASATLASCTTNEPGQAVSAGDPATVSPSGTSSTSGAPTVAIPPRPKELKLDGVEPCDLFTSTQIAQLKLDRKRKTVSQSQHYNGMRDCALDSNSAPFDHYSALAVTNEGAELWLTGKRNVEAKVSSVAGYGAATYWILGANGHNTDGCSTAVDVAHGQQLIVTADNDGKHSYTLEELCQRAEKAAGLAVQTLQTLK